MTRPRKKLEPTPTEPTLVIASRSGRSRAFIWMGVKAGQPKATCAIQLLGEPEPGAPKEV